MIKLNQTLGFYTPAFFKIYIASVNPINPSQMNGQELTTFIHEYTHFIQDFTTIYGLSNIYNLIDWLRLYINKIYTCRKLSLPLNLYNENLYLNDQIRRLAWGTPTSYHPISAIRNIQIQPHTLSNYIINTHPELSTFRKVLLEIEVNHNWIQIEFGALAIMESMAHLMEYFLNPTHITEAPDYPYTIAQLVSSSLNPQLDTKYDIIFALCDIALQTSLPGPAFVEMVIQLSKNSNYTADDVYKFFDKPFQHWHDRQPNSLVNIAYSHLNSLVQGPMGLRYQAWVHNLMETAIGIRRSKPSFMLDIIRGGFPHTNMAFSSFLNQVGTPLLTNAIGDMYKVPAPIYSIFPIDYDVEYFQAIEYIYELLISGKVPCSMKDWCSKSGISIDNNCITNPPAHSNNKTYNRLCPVGALWHQWNLKKYTLRPPILFRKICN